MAEYTALSVLKKKIAALKRLGKKIVFTNGCFDVIHAGHIALLRKAKSLGDILVVGLNSDSSVKKLKGPKRPILSISERAGILAALKYVDFVAVFAEDTPAKLIKQIRPDILVKGGDYAAREIVGREYVKKVARVRLVKGKSTTGIIQRIVKAYGR